MNKAGSRGGHRWISINIICLASLPIYYYIIGPALFSVTVSGGLSIIIAIVFGTLAFAFGVASYKALKGPKKVFAVMAALAGLAYILYAFVGNYFL